MSATEWSVECARILLERREADGMIKGFWLS
jgi:hypothetical protein